MKHSCSARFLMPSSNLDVGTFGLFCIPTCSSSSSHHWVSDTAIPRATPPFPPSVAPPAYQTTLSCHTIPSHIRSCGALASDMYLKVSQVCKRSRGDPYGHVRNCLIQNMQVHFSNGNRWSGDGGWLDMSDKMTRSLVSKT